MMTLDENLMKDAAAARDRVLDLEHQTDRARVDYHHSIRRLHAGGGSLREIAEALSLSHQRVHQIVDSLATEGRRPETHEVRRRLGRLAPFERFTREARRTVVFATEEAESLGHRRVGTEHLLLGLLRDSGGPAARALERLGVDHAKVRDEVTRLHGVREPTPGRRPFTRAARDVLEIALREAHDLGHRHIGGEHILLGIIARGDAAAILAGLDAPADKVREELRGVLAD